MRLPRPSTPCLGKQLDVLFFRRLVICGICGEPIDDRKSCEWDHIFEHADGGPNDMTNLRPVHNKASGGCHKRKSARAESQRSKIDRLEKVRIEFKPQGGDAPEPEENMPGAVTRQSRSRWGSRKFPHNPNYQWPKQKMRRQKSRQGEK